ncbi:MAG: DUF4293 domain-containing protein [Ferruginibacter sp.]
MLQRIQTIWLLLAAACVFAGLKFPFYSGINVSGEQQYVLRGTENILFMLLTVCTGLLAVIAIGMYKNRPMQLKLCIAAVVLQLVLIYMYYHYTKTIFLTSTYNTYALWAVFQPAVLIFLVLAIAGIRRDNKIIKESNRLR